MRPRSFGKKQRRAKINLDIVLVKIDTLFYTLYLKAQTSKKVSVGVYFLQAFFFNKSFPKFVPFFLLKNLFQRVNSFLK